MQEQLWITELLNKVLGGPVNAILQALPPAFHPNNPAAPISNSVAMEFLVVGILIAFFLIVRSNLSVDKPGKAQHLAEMFNEFISNQGEEIIGHGSETFTPFLASIFLFILVGNLIGLVPTLESPTGEVTATLGLALVTFIYYNAHGLRAQGLWGYFKHFWGPVWWLGWFILPIELISHLARVMSLSVRLYANIFAGDMVTTMFFTMLPVGLPVIFLLLHVAVSLLQAYIFTLLTTIYLQGAVSHEH